MENYKYLRQISKYKEQNSKNPNITVNIVIRDIKVRTVKGFCPLKRTYLSTVVVVQLVTLFLNNLNK